MIEHDCERRGCDMQHWKNIGEVSTENGTLAIVPPYYGNTLGQWWEDYLTLPIEDRRPDTWKVKQLDLRQITTSVTNPDGYEDREAALLIPCDNGTYDVLARYCDLYGDGHLTICEVRLVLHNVEHEDDDEE
jgi:hypothetical protein